MRAERVWHVELLADHPELIPAVGEVRWREWGHWEGQDLAWFVDITRRESGRTELPVTLVGLNADAPELRRQGAGAVGIGKVDPPELQDRGPWVIGVIVAPELRRQGAGRAILGHALRWAADQGYDPVWVATGPDAAGFYQSCGWELTKTYRGQRHDEVMILRCATGAARPHSGIRRKGLR
jgi:GNAT superfamily N-acetyltransferase